MSETAVKSSYDMLHWARMVYTGAELSKFWCGTIRGVLCASKVVEKIGRYDPTTRRINDAREQHVYQRAHLQSKAHRG